MSWKPKRWRAKSPESRGQSRGQYGTYPHQERFGDIEATVQDRRTLPGWVGGVLLGAGRVLVIVGMKRSR